MDNKFIETLEYLRNLKSEIISSSLCVEERILIDIKRAVLEDIFNRGSIILTKDEFGYKVSNIQKHSYAWKFKDMYIDLSIIFNELGELNIEYKLLPYKINDKKNNYELIFGIDFFKKDIKRKTREK